VRRKRCYEVPCQEHRTRPFAQNAKERGTLVIATVRRNLSHHRRKLSGEGKLPNHSRIGRKEMGYVPSVPGFVRRCILNSGHVA
jgi:hypothetical protein